MLGDVWHAKVGYGNFHIYGVLGFSEPWWVEVRYGFIYYISYIVMIVVIN